MATVKLHSLKEGKLLSFELAIENQEVVARNSDTEEFYKFPGGLTKKQFLKQVDEINKANDGVKAISEEELEADRKLDEANEKLLESL